jgi:hypothetical protein
MERLYIYLPTLARDQPSAHPTAFDAVVFFPVTALSGWVHDRGIDNPAIAGLAAGRFP